MQNWRPYVAEFIATFALIFVGAGSVIANNYSGGDLGTTGVALAHGLILAVMVYATAHLSGAHINPAVTIAMWVTKRIDTLKGLYYILAQLTGATVAGFALKAIYANATLPWLNIAETQNTLGTPAIAPDLTLLSGILVEMILTFLLVFVIFGVAVDKRAPAGFFGLAIGLTVAADILIGGALTGGAMNPARAFGPALASGTFEMHLAYWIGPVLGAVVAAVLYDYLFLDAAKPGANKA